jgi:hypothetical protein
MIKADDHGDDEPPRRLEGGRCEGLAQVGAGTMTSARASLKTAIKMAFNPSLDCRNGKHGVYGILNGIAAKEGQLLA